MGETKENERGDGCHAVEREVEQKNPGEPPTELRIAHSSEVTLPLWQIDSEKDPDYALPNLMAGKMLDRGQRKKAVVAIQPGKVTLRAEETDSSTHLFQAEVLRVFPDDMTFSPMDPEVIGAYTEVRQMSTRVPDVPSWSLHAMSLDQKTC